MCVEAGLKEEMDLGKHTGKFSKSSNKDAEGLHFTMGLTQGTAEPRTSHQPLPADTDVPSFNPITG